MTVSLPTTAGAWVVAHEKDVPRALIARVQGVMMFNEPLAWLPAAEGLLVTGELLLQAVLKDSEAGRAVALDLLAADTCVTWAFEAAAEEPGTLPARAEAAMTRIAELSL